MQLITLPARRAFIAAILIFLLLYSGFAYTAIAIFVVFLLSWFFFPIKQPRDFCAGVIPAIDSLANYLKKLSNGEVAPEFEYAIFKSFLRGSRYPEWVYYSGFNPALRSGFRHFLIHLEYAADLCCSTAYWYANTNDLADKKELLQLLQASLKVNIDLLAGLSRTMHHHAEKTPRPVNDSNVDFVSDITELEGALQRLVPGSLELLDLAPEYVQLTILVRNVKDLREVILLLVNGVPGM